MAESMLTDDEALSYAQGIRKRLVEDMLKDGKLPTDNDERNTMLRALEGMAGAALGNKRLKKDEVANENQRNAQQILGQLFGLLGTKNPHEKPIEGQAREVPVPAALLEEATLVPGQMDIGVSSETYDTFAEKHDM